MRAVEMRHFGGPEVLSIVEHATPSPAPGQALVRVGAAGVNLADTLMRQNRYAVTPELPCIPGSEVAGTVVAIGSAAEGVAVGTRVACPLFFSGSLGGYADHVLIDASLLVPLPDDVSFESASAVMVQGLTRLLLTKTVPPAVKRVLVTAAGGGVGSLLVQVAKRAGAATVVAAASSQAKLELARSLGADAGIDYSEHSWLDRARDVFASEGPDVIYESTGGDVTKACLALLAPRGQIVLYGALNIQSFDLGVPELLGMIFKNQSLTGFAFVPLLTAQSLVAMLRDLFRRVERGELQVVIGGIYPLAGAADAHRALEGRRTKGKLLLVP